MAGIRTDIKNLEMQGLLSHIVRHGSGEGLWQPPTDVFETEHEVVVCMEIPGLKREAIGIQFAHNTLTISGERESEASAQKVQFIQMEINYGRFLREITIYKPVRPEKLVARYADGFLKVVLPKV
jgi:HSP20 family protein